MYNWIERINELSICVSVLIRISVNGSNSKFIFLLGTSVQENVYKKGLKNFVNHYRVFTTNTVRQVLFDIETYTSSSALFSGTGDKEIRFPRRSLPGCVCRRQIFCPKPSEEQKKKKKVITSADIQFFDQNQIKSKKRSSRPQMFCISLKISVWS